MADVVAMDLVTNVLVAVTRACYPKASVFQGNMLRAHAGHCFKVTISAFCGFTV
jgi:hypothetical protein